MKKKINKFMSSIMQGIDCFTDWCFYAGGILLFVLPLIMSYEVVMRYFFNKPTSWAGDCSEYILIYSTFFAAGWLLREKELISMVFVINRVKGRNRCILEIIQSLMGIFACGSMFWSGFYATRVALEKWLLIVRPFEIPKFIILWVIPFGELMLLIYFIKNFCSSLRSVLKLKDSMTIQETDESIKKATSSSLDKGAGL